VKPHSLHYRNAVDLLYVISDNLYRRLQSAQNAAARLTMRTSSSTHHTRVTRSEGNALAANICMHMGTHRQTQSYTIYFNYTIIRALGVCWRHVCLSEAAACSDCFLVAVYQFTNKLYLLICPRKFSGKMQDRCTIVGRRRNWQLGHDFRSFVTISRDSVDILQWLQSVCIACNAELSYYPEQFCLSLCLSVRPSVRHVLVFCPDEWRYDRAVFSVW